MCLKGCQILQCSHQYCQSQWPWILNFLEFLFQYSSDSIVSTHTVCNEEIWVPKNSYVIISCQGLKIRGWKTTPYSCVQITLHELFGWALPLFFCPTEVDNVVFQFLQKLLRSLEIHPVFSSSVSVMAYTLINVSFWKWNIHRFTWVVILGGKKKIEKKSKRSMHPWLH